MADNIWLGKHQTLHKSRNRRQRRRDRGKIPHEPAKFCRCFDNGERHAWVASGFYPRPCVAGASAFTTRARTNSAGHYQCRCLCEEVLREPTSEDRTIADVVCYETLTEQIKEVLAGWPYRSGGSSGRRYCLASSGRYAHYWLRIRLEKPEAIAEAAGVVSK